MVSPAQELYGSNYLVINRYVDILASDGVDRGLIGPRELGRLWERHILNSAALAQLIHSGSSVVDVGSGAGLPGIPIAVLRPDLKVTLLEPLLRRSTFLTQIVDDLGLRSRVRVVRARAEDHSDRYGVVVARALAPLEKLVGWTNPLRTPGGTILALKGEGAGGEVDTARDLLAQLKLIAEILTVRAHPDADDATVVALRPGLGERHYSGRQ
jgi:16S rRNA (guanine527-N7)-methyltransferase